ncbi:MAG: 2-isopropylmalate synthase [Lentisphaeria bacterium]|nr:2-isopropylmalate synthase [Lentisphaeria bacterium]
MTARYAQPPAIAMSERRWPGNSIVKAPTWCAVDLRDGNQALPNPMTPVQKRAYYDLLVRIGFKEIEIGFPSASADDFQFCRDLIEQNAIPEDVTISVLTQAREHLIRRTFEALRDVRRAICHVYIATSDLHMGFVFGKTPEQTKQTALESVRLIRQLADAMPDSDIRLEFSPEEFTDSELPFVVDLCDNVIETWGPKPGEKVVMNLPATVERRLPTHYADMIEAYLGAQKHPESTLVSLHAHNDMGSAVAATELALMAGAHRVEGTLFGHGERSGNVDLVTIALNLQYLGLETGLDFRGIEEIRDTVADLTGLPAHVRHPYAGELVFSAFSGSHQDAIHKGLGNAEKLRQHFGGWKIPYLHIDPKDIGRSYEKFIRINSQSGKGGIAHVLEKEYGVRLPRPLLVELSAHVQAFADKVQREVQSREVWEIFIREFARRDGPLQLVNYWPRPNADDPKIIEGEVHVDFRGERRILHGTAGGPIAAFVKAVRQLPIPEFSLQEYEEDAIGSSADAEAITFVRLEKQGDGAFYGVGFGHNIDQAAVGAIVSGVNRLMEHPTP